MFGSNAKEARKTDRTPAQWKAALRKVLRELHLYVQANVDSDELHFHIVATGLLAASESLNDEDFWPGYAEGITRVALALLGDYPDHRRRNGGAKSSDHYLLNPHRTVLYTQTGEQRFRTLMAAGVFGVPGLSVPPREVLTKYRERFGTGQTRLHFLRWYRKHFPSDYAAVFS